MNLKGSYDFIVRDVTDIGHPSTVANLRGQVDYRSRFVNAGELSTTVGGTALVRMPLVGSPTTVVANCGAGLLAWSPDGTTAAYISQAADTAFQELHIVRDGSDRVVDRMPALQYGTGCESRGCADNWDLQLLYSPDGTYVSFVQQLPVAVFRIWTSDGRLVKSMDGTPATMSVWSGTTFFWRDGKGVETWRNGAQSLLLPGVTWIRPHASSAGGQIVYETRDAGYTTAHVWVLDTASGSVRQIALSRSEPAFLTDRYVWYQGEAACGGGGCISPAVSTGITYLYDLQSGVESQSIISVVYDVWPHPA